jgi:hypothetical protein
MQKRANVDDPNISEEGRLLLRLSLERFGEEYAEEFNLPVDANKRMFIQLWELGYIRLIAHRDGGIGIAPCMPEDAPQLQDAAAIQ